MTNFLASVVYGVVALLLLALRFHTDGDDFAAPLLARAVLV